MNAITSIPSEDRLETIAGKITQGIYAAPLDRATPRQRGLAMMIAGNIASALFARPIVSAANDRADACHTCLNPIDDRAAKGGFSIRLLNDGEPKPICSNCAEEPA